MPPLRAKLSFALPPVSSCEAFCTASPPPSPGPPRGACAQECIGETGGNRDVVARLLSKISTLNEAAAKAEATRRDLHNQLMEVRGNVSAWRRRPGARALHQIGRAHV